MKTQKTIIFKLDEYLKEKGIPKLRFSKDSGLDYRTVLRYCKNDVKNIKVFILETICNTLGCDVQDIVDLK